MRVRLLTYDVPHKKTLDVLYRLVRRSCFELGLVIVPFKKRPDRTVLFNHRPNQFVGASGENAARKMGLPIHDLAEWESLLPITDYFLVCGAGLLDGRFVSEARIVNCHPGLIPRDRGLDAFKWAILQSDQLGVTLHFIDSGVDMGQVFHQEITDVYFEDDIASLADRHYEAEIDLLANFDRYLNAGTILELPERPPHKRMPLEAEAEMLRNIDRYKNAWACRENLKRQACRGRAGR